MTAMPSGADWLEIFPIPNDIGSIPAIIAILVIMIGRILFLAPSRKEVRLPIFRLSSALVTNRIPFATATPTAMMVPMYDWIFREFPVTSIRNNEPEITAGMMDNITRPILND